MATNLSEFIIRLRKDLHDEDSSAYRWTDAVLQRHIERAVRDFSIALPLQEKATLQTTMGSRDISISTLANLVHVEKVEYPVDKYPPCYARWKLWNDKITLLVDEAPGDAESVYVYWCSVHTVDAVGSTIPAPYEDLVATGAAAYAALEWASYATNRVNVGGEDTDRAYLEWGKGRLAEFQKGLAAVNYKGRLRVQQLHPA